MQFKRAVCLEKLDTRSDIRDRQFVRMIYEKRFSSLDPREREREKEREGRREEVHRLVALRFYQAAN